jgi:antitoxin MazE
MRAKIAQWGNSTGIRIPKALVEVVGLSANDIVEITAENEALIIKPLREHVTLEKLFHNFEQNAPDAYDWGELDAPAGKELL